MSEFKITKVWARRYLKAVEKLIATYKVSDGSYPCPFCETREKYYLKDNKLLGHNSACKSCPWVVFKGGCCDNRDGKGFMYYIDPIPVRLRRLYGWRVRFKNIIKKGART